VTFHTQGVHERVAQVDSVFKEQYARHGAVQLS
jgi:hypothetical protein